MLPFKCAKFILRANYTYLCLKLSKTRKKLKFILKVYFNTLNSHFKQRSLKDNINTKKIYSKFLGLGDRLKILAG